MPTQPFKVKAAYDYASPHEEDLSFPTGQIITVTEEEDDDWYQGEYKDADGITKKGLFPRNFVEKFEPVAPPRPTRAPKKEAAPPLREPEPESKPAAEPTPVPVAEAEDDESELIEAEDKRLEPEPEPERVVEPAKPEPVAPKAQSPPASAVKPAPTTEKRAAPPVAEKPSSFKDRIAAFNKPAAAPVAPVKPGGLSGSSSGFIKKPFVPPPPSRNAYVPPPRETPQKIYRREEEPEHTATEFKPAPDLAPAPTVEPEEEQPKPTSLKDRIALLQKQQLEQQSRHAEAAAKKEKPKRPPKKRTESHQSSEAGAEEEPRPPETEDEEPPTRPPKRRSKSKEVVPASGAPRELVSDTNDADQSADPETEDPEPSSVRRIATEEPVEEEVEEDEGDEGGREEEEEEVDPEVRRRMEIRERMAKMSGGMGMAGMFGPAGGMSPMTRKKARPEERKRVDSNESAEAAPVAVMALPGMSMPGMAKKAPEPQVEKEPEPVGPMVDEPEEVPDVEDVDKHTPHARREESASIPEERPVPPVPQERPAPPPLTDSRPAPPPPAEEDSGSESDDEMSSRPPVLALNTKPATNESLTSRAPPPLPATNPRSPEKIASPTSPDSAAKRIAQAPPIPGAPPPIPGSQARPPPPPPPQAPEEPDSEEEVTEYEGDYDTDIGPNATHKDALKARDKNDSTDDTLTGDEAPYHHSGLPSLGLTNRPPVPNSAPRGAPPPPPSQPPRQAPADRPPPPPPSQPPRKSSEVPRGLPPPPPPKEDDEYDPFNYSSPTRSASGGGTAVTPRAEESFDDLYGSSPPRPPPPAAPSQPPPPPTAQAPPQPPSQPPKPRQSLEAPRASLSGRRSVDAPRVSSDQQGFIADDIDLGRGSQWWAQRRMAPPSLQERTDVAFEIEESTAIQDGKELVSKHVYALWMDHSQTIIAARYNPQDPSYADLSQRHEPPPARPRQDQLEEAHGRYGSRIAEMAKTKENHAVGNGTAIALVTELLRELPAALPPVGTRAFGALVYVNLGNAAVQQHDEIRPGDIVSFRNAKLQGHKGAMKQKYSTEVGKPDHVGVVVDWDGTKKKIRAWEQGRESKKVKVESFKLSDLRSGEVKVWRVMPRMWVGWGSP